MPTKSYENNLVLGLRGEDGEFHAIGQLVETSEVISPSVSRQGEIPGTLKTTLDCIFQKLTLADFVLYQFYGYPMEKLIQNNWRKLHGLPMKRRKR